MVNVIKVEPISKPEEVDKHEITKPGNAVYRWMSKSFRDFCKSTALHGYGYIVQEDNTKWEKIFWILLIVSATVAAIVLLYISWIWNSETPTVTVIESTHYPTWNIPFPAITICSMNKISRARAFSLAQRMVKPPNVSTEDLVNMYPLLVHFDTVTNGSTDAEYQRLNNIMTTNNMSTLQVMMAITPTCNEMLQRCMWKGTQSRCDTLFQSVNSSRGLCCSFNYYGRQEDNYGSKMAHNVPKFPRRVSACGYMTGVTVLLNPQIYDYHTTIFSSYGFRVFIHNAYDYPDDNAETKVVTSNLEAFISIAPEATYSTDSVKNLKVEDRKCYFDDEFKLGYLNKYTFFNCMAECRSKIVYDNCGCVPYTFPNNGTFPYCMPKDIPCVVNNRNLFAVSIPGVTNISELTTDHMTNNLCSYCLPDCQMFQYPAEITFGKFDRKYSFNSIAFFKDITITNQTLLNIFFNDLIATHYRTDIYINWLGILASFGGLLGLLLGFSFITGFELFYFFTLRGIFDKFTKTEGSSK